MDEVPGWEISLLKSATSQICCHVTKRGWTSQLLDFFLFFFFTLVTGSRRSFSLELSVTKVYEPQIRARLGTTVHFCTVVASQRYRKQITGSCKSCMLTLGGLCIPLLSPYLSVQGYLTDKKTHPNRTLP